MTSWKIPAGLSLVLFVAFALYFRTIIVVPGINSDLNAHIGFAKSAFEGKGVWPRHIMYFALVAMTSFWSAALSVWQTSGWLWLSVFTVAKFLATLWFGYFWVGRRGELPPGGANARQIQLAIMAIALGMTVMFCFAQPAAYLQGLWYAYSFPPNTWHNSTQIVLAPFALVLFGLSVRQFERPDRIAGVAAIVAAAVLSALAKPSFLMAWLPAYGLCTLFIWVRTGSLRIFVLAASPLIVATAILAAQYYLIYATEINGTSVEIGYLTSWTSRVNRTEFQFYVSIFFSSLFPIVFYLFHPQRLTELSHIFAIMIVAISYAYAAGLSEVGATQSGNFMWPIISANFVSYTLCAFDLYALRLAHRETASTRSPLRFVLPGIVFAVSAAWGVAYMIRCLVFGAFG